MTIFCIGRNYIDHAKELNNPVPSKPVVFCKPATALLRENKAFYYPDFTKDLHYEVELVLKIGKSGKCIPITKADDYFSHIGLGIDFTARDIQEECKSKGLPWEIAKGFDNSAVLSEWIEKEKLDLTNIHFSLTKNKSIVLLRNQINFKLAIHIGTNYIRFIYIFANHFKLKLCHIYLHQNPYQRVIQIK